MVEGLLALQAPDNDTVLAAVAEDDMDGRLAPRAKIDDLEARLREAVGAAPATDCEHTTGLTHHFIDGVYVRELFIPADTLLVGKLHRYPRICVIAEGDVSFATEFGVQRVAAPYTTVVPAGSKTAVYTHTDTTWLAVHRTDETDLKRIEAELIAEGG